MGRNFTCPVMKEKERNAKRFMREASAEKKNKMNVMWLEACGCSGNIISFLNSSEPDLNYFIDNVINLRFSNSIMAAEGQLAYEVFLDMLMTEFVLIVEGAISTRSNGYMNIVANYKGRAITALDAARTASERAKHVLAVGTCASFGGISAARPNPAECKEVQQVIQREVIRLPGCPCNPVWLGGTLAHIHAKGVPELDEKNRPLQFYGMTIHDTCPRRTYFNQGIFARKLGDKECMFKLGCRGPVTRTSCALDKWNGGVNWPIGDNTPCIGCANERFPDGMEPWVRY